MHYNGLRGSWGMTIAFVLSEHFVLERKYLSSRQRGQYHLFSKDRGKDLAIFTETHSAAVVNWCNYCSNIEGRLGSSLHGVRHFGARSCVSSTRGRILQLIRMQIGPEDVAVSATLQQFYSSQESYL